jgi:tetratricopeptide (TPR) repeat protein
MTEGLTSSGEPGIPDSAADANSMHTTSQWGSETWNPVSLDQSASLSEASAAPVEPWDSLQDALNNINPETVRQISDPGIVTSNDHSWLGSDISASSASSSENVAESTHSVDEILDVPFSYDAENESNNGSAAPDWLSMLNHNEPQASIPQSSSIPVEPTSFGAEEPPALQPELEKPQPLQASVPVPQSQAPASQPQVTSDEVLERARTTESEANEDGDEEIFFGPGWLKTLGATSLDGTDAFDFSALEEEPSALVEQPAAPEQNLAEVASPDDQQEVQPSSEYAESPQYSSSEEPQATQEEDAWATWQPASSYSAPTDQESYQPWPDFANQPQDEQSFWSLPQQENPAVSNQEQPSWMSQLSQSSQSSQENAASAYTDWASQPSDPWDSSSQDAHITATPEPTGQQRMQDQAYGDDPWNSRLEQVSPPSAQEEVDPWSQLNQQAQAQSIDYNWLAQLAGQQPAVEPEQADDYPEVDTGFSAFQQDSPTEQEKTEQNLITTLEELEQKLLSHGFTPLEPNSLASIAQANPEEAHIPPAATESSARAPREDAEPSLSSALAELGNFGRSGVNPVEPVINEPFGMPVPNVGQEQVQPSEPLWLSSIAPVADPGIAAQVTASEKPGEDATVRVSAMPAERLGRQSTSPLPAGPVSDPAFIPTNPTPAPAPAIRMNVLLDSELETTMKRPAVRLQPIQQQVASRDHNGTAHAGRGRNSERSGQRQAESKGSVSYRERLVRGYQAQLIGDFDEAMQEYRLIIRNAPELLGEVVSNVRALLKLAPNYSAGYRVLGDAYMRQGEYLQAMESYNKALTMAKKAKG